MNVSRSMLLLAALSLPACAQGSREAGVVAHRCDRPSPTSPGPQSFKAEVIAFEPDAMHVDFDDFGAEFSAAEIRFVGPDAWKGRTEKVYYQGEPTFGGAPLSVGASIEFVASPPACLDGTWPWLYLSGLKAK
jgi:hypothetical protein